MTTQDSLRVALLTLAITFAAGLLFVNVYNSVVDVPNWSSSIQAARAYFESATPGTFFRVASPVNQGIALVALILCWRVDSSLRYWCLAGLGLAVAGDMLTMSYFYPRNAILFQGSATDGDAVRQALSQWATMNWVRSVGVGLNVLVNFGALIRYMGMRA